MASKTIALTVNGNRYHLEIDTRSRLVDVIRDRLQLTGTHIGCGTGNCGACTVFLDGRTAKSCCVLAVEADGGVIVTIEGIGSEDELHPVQEAFIDNHGLQCGFCTPGMILSALQLIHDIPNPDADEIREAIAGNVCRCTGYAKIIESIQDAAQRIATASNG